MCYRSLNRISNSDLTEFRDFIFDLTRPKPVKAFCFGSTLHELILERSDRKPVADVSLIEGLDYSLIEKLASRVQADRFCAWALQFSQKETVQLWSDPATGLPLKSRLDIVHKNRLIVDIKSTSQRTYVDFLRSLSRYDYDRQAAFYLDSIGARRFMFVGVQKVKPYNIWIVEPSSGFLATGRKKYRALLREWKRREDAGQPFRPSSWMTEPEPKPCL